MLEGLPNARDIQKISISLQDLAEPFRGGLIIVVGRNGGDSLLECQ